MVCERQPAGACDHRVERQVSKLCVCILQKGRKSFPDIGVMPLIIREEQIVCCIQDRDLYRGRTDVDPKCIKLLILIHENNHAFL